MTGREKPPQMIGPTFRALHAAYMRDPDRLYGEVSGMDTAELRALFTAALDLTTACWEEMYRRDMNRRHGRG